MSPTRPPATGGSRRDGPPPARPGGWRQARLVAGITFRDARRRPATWRTTLLTGLVIAVLLAGASSVSERVQDRAEDISYGVAVDGDLAGGRRLVSNLTTDRLAVRSSADAQEEVRLARAAAGVRLPPAVDDRVARGEPVELQVFYRDGQDNSRQARDELALRLQQLEVALVAGPSVVPPAPVTVVEAQVARDERVSRSQLARTLAALAPFLCLGVISSVAALVGISRQQRTLEPLLLLPADRRALLGGLVVGAAPTAVVPVMAAEGFLVAISALPVLGLSQPISAVLAMLVVALPAAALVGVLACATGGLAGTLGAGGDDAVALGDFLSIPFVAVGALLFLRPDLPTGAPLCAVPILGPALALRDGIAGTLDPVAALVAVTSTFVWSLVVVLFASRRLGGG